MARRRTRRNRGIALAATGVALSATIVAVLSRRRSWPCPAWLSASLENPYVERVAGAGTLLERAGVRPGMRVLDAGCGPGRLTLPASEIVGATGRVVALDVQPAMLDKLDRRLTARGVTNVDPVLGGLGEGRLEENAFDVALLVTVLGEVPDKSAALSEIRRSLRAGGRLSITEVLPDPHYQRLARVRALARAAGFTETRLYPGWASYTINYACSSPNPSDLR